eukprot:TRINITY_DN105155_c0_g1_i1.p1 TRINITY_DN105155_c0_g1~~TRINITY_DN105155_c0_g1_i1.p1  ORF type:complete len:578 (-),score=74.27 TRINITY_DN105155_c0_g1_i1:335-2068(-)
MGSLMDGVQRGLCYWICVQHHIQPFQGCYASYSFDIQSFVQQIDELVMFDAIYFFAYALLVAFFYALEYKVRYDFFLNHTHAEFQKSYRKLLKNLPNSIIVLDQENNTLFYNRMVGQMIEAKFPRADNNPNVNAKPQIVHKETLLSVLGDVMQQDNNNVNLKHVLQSWKNGALNDSKKYIYNTESNEYTYTIKGIQTIFQSTPCKALIMQDQSAFEKLAKLDEKYQKLYVASIVHDIRTPLNGISGMLEMIDSSTKSPEKKQYISVARKTCKLLLFLTYDITDYSQLQAGKFKANNSLINVRDILDEVSQLLSFSFEKKGLASYFSANEAVPSFVFIDKNRYMQILLNLVGNALKFTFSGEITVLVEYNPMNDTLTTIVKDTGVGIKPEELPKLFQFFGKLDSTSSINPHGVGFGLAICKRLSESLGGSINATSVYGSGTTFTFGIKANLKILQEEPINSKEESAELDTSSRVSPGDIEKKVQEHDFRKMEPYNRLLTIEENEESKQITQTLHRLEEAKGCTCKKVLIVDDGEYNLFVLQSYLKSSNIHFDEVLFLETNTKIGTERRRRYKENRGKS